ncbi:MAG: hypothetical protein RSH25_13800 [Bacteroides sp.]|uniref:DUF7833 domain-containing protein n=1 Tax=Bacteroides sp. TaxID=29523 RepID=UPI002FCAA766
MTYIDYMNQFWQMNRSVEFSSNEVFLYFYLLNECNIRGWQNPFEHPNKIIVLATGISEKTVIEVRNRLQQKGLINFEAGKRNAKSPIYYLLDVSKTGSKKVSKTVSKKVSKTGNLNIKTKENKTINSLRVCVGDLFSENSFFDKSLDDCYMELKKNQHWAETLTMNTRSAGYHEFTLESFYEYLERFFMKLQNEGETAKAPKDAMSYFSRWLELKLKNEKDERRTNKSGARGNSIPGAVNQGSNASGSASDSQADDLKEWINGLPIGQ